MSRTKMRGNSNSFNARRASLLVTAAVVGVLLTTGGTASAKGNGHEVKTASLASEYPTVNITIDGQPQYFEQSAVLKDGNTLVPLRGIFEKLGAEVKWDQDTQTVTAIKGGTSIKLTIGAQTANVNGAAVQLAAKAEIINGSTMVPLRFVSEALGADVQWDNVNTMAIITSTGGTAPVVQAPVVSAPAGPTQQVHGINVQYGRHDYKSGSQAEYDKVMEIVNEVTANSSSIRFGDKYEQYFRNYLNGDRAENYPRNTMDSIGLSKAKGSIGDLVAAGISKENVEKLYRATVIAGDLIRGIQDPLDGSPESAYDALVRGTTDCDSDAQVYSAVFDAMGFNTAISAKPGHAQVIVGVDGTWFGTVAGSFVETTLPASASSRTGGAFLHTAPTFN
jgi:hypothetical protein